ncbi:hypothetical protein DN402_16385 [Streptomyces sp. SW4]|nr:hypothetical protein DN402_16385 [Streptomyces sp. SW4]
MRESGLVWDLPDTYVLRGEDRVVLAATRRGLAELLGRRGRGGGRMCRGAAPTTPPGAPPPGPPDLCPPHHPTRSAERRRSPHDSVGREAGSGGRGRVVPCGSVGGSVGRGAGTAGSGGAGTRVVGLREAAVGQGLGRWRAAKSSSRRTCLMRSSTTREPWPAS